VTALGELEPVELLEPDVPDPAVLENPLDPLEPAEVPDPPVLDPAVFADPLALELAPAVFDEPPAAVLALAVLRESAGSCPVISTIAITDHITMNRATEYPITRPRMVRTRACRICLILIASADPMGERIGSPRSRHVWAG
jgi:hypothetical protein